MNSEQIRREFEEWAPPHGFILGMCSETHYAFDDTQCAWEAYQAAALKRNIAIKYLRAQLRVIAEFDGDEVISKIANDALSHPQCKDL